MKRPICPPGTVFLMIWLIGVPRYLAASSTCSGGGDVIRRTGYVISRTGDIAEVQFPAEADKLTLGETVLLEQLCDHLQIPTSRQVYRVFIRTLERLFLGEVSGVAGMLV